jgi:CBS domain-containing protein
MLEANQRIVPINGPDGRLMGLVTLGDVRKVPREQWSTTPAHAIMTRSDELRTVSPDEDLRSAMQALAEKNYHQLPVLEDGHLVGILNRGHVLQYLHMRERLGVEEPSAISDQPSAMSR